MGALLYLPRGVDERSARAAPAARIPGAVRFQEKWRLALTLLRRTRAAGMTLTAVVADAEYGDNTHRAADAASAAAAVCAGDLADADGVSGHADAARRSHATAAAQSPRRAGPTTTPSASARSATRCRRARGDASRGAMGPIRRGKPTSRPCASRPATDWRQRRLAPRSGCSASAASGPTGRRKHYLVSLPATASLAQLVRLAHQRWAIEQHYQDLKTELGLDHFEGRSYPGWQHHMAISAVAYAFLQTERMRPRDGTRADVSAGARLRPGNLYRAAVYQPPTIHAVDEASRAAVSSATHLTKSY